MILKMRAGVLGAPQYFRANTFPALLGRASRADIWIAHPQISLAHGRIERREDGKLWIVDLDSRNGLRKDGTLTPAFELTNGAHFSIGSLRFEVDLEEHEADESTEVHTLADLGPTFFGQTQAEWGKTGLCFGVQALVYGLGSYLGRPESDRAGHAAVVTLLTMPLAFLGALALALLAKLHRGQYKYWALYRRASLCLILLGLWWNSADLVAFNVPGIQSTEYVATFFLAVIFFLGFYLLARPIFPELPAARVAKWVGAVDGALFGFIFMVAVLSDSGRARFYGGYGLPLLHWKLPSSQETLQQLDRDLARLATKRVEQRKEWIGD